MPPQASNPKDLWDIVGILGQTSIPIVIAIVGILANRQLSKINECLGNAQRDVTVAEQFSQIYFKPESRRLAPHFVSLIESPATRFELRMFMIWDVLEKQIRADKPFTFNSEESDWHLLGEAMQGALGDDSQGAINYWGEIKTVCLTRWSNHSEELKKLYQWIEDTYHIPT